MENTTTTLKIPKKSYIIAYILWMFGGWFGAHRFYTRRWFTGFLYAVSLGIFFIGWTIDFFLVYFMVRGVNKKMRAEAEEHPEFAMPEEPARLAPWAGQRDWKTYLEFPMRLVFFLFGPVLFAAVVIIVVDQIELLAIMVLILVATGLMGSVEKTLRRYRALEKIPVLGDAMQSLQQFYDYYYHNKPRSFFFYLFYPVLGFLLLPFSASARTEFKLYVRILGAIAMILVIETVFSYPNTYPPHLNWEDALLIVVLQLFFMFFASIAFLMPIVTTSFALNLSGRHVSLRFLTIMALLIAIPFSVFIYQENTASTSFISSQILHERIKKENFRKDFAEISHMFLSYYAQQKTTVDAADVVLDADLTQKYRHHIRGVMTGDEVNVFGVIVFADPRTDQKRAWCGVRSTQNGNPAILYLVDQEGKFYQSWNELPAAVREHFKIEEDRSAPTVKKLSQPPCVIYYRALMDEYWKML